MFIKLFIMAACLLGNNFYDDMPEYTIAVDQKQEMLQINVKTFQEKNCICFLSPEKINIIKPEGKSLGIIEVDFIVSSDSKCLMAKGHYQGTAEINKTSIDDGCYSLIINGHDYGFLIVEEKDVYFQGINII